MTLGTHAVVGAIIISKFPEHPVLGFCLAFGSHFILDALPHWDYHLSSLQENKNDPMKNKMPITRKFLEDLFKMGADFLLGVVTVILLFAHIKHSLLLLGIIGGVLPDFLQFLYFRTQKEPLVIIQRFHMWIHTQKKMKKARVLSIASQIVLITVIYLIVVFY